MQKVFKILLITFSITILALILRPNDPRIKIVVIDSGIDQTNDIVKPYICSTGHQSFVNTSPLVDESSHGTLVSELIVKDLDPAKYCLISIKWINEEGYGLNPLLFTYLLFLNHQYINASYSDSEPGVFSIFYRLLLARGIHAFISAGNDHINLDEYDSYPPSYRLDPQYFHIIGDYIGNQEGLYSNYGSIVQYYIPGNYKGWYGTSFSAPRALNLYLKGQLGSPHNTK